MIFAISMLIGSFSSLLAFSLPPSFTENRTSWIGGELVPLLDILVAINAASFGGVDTPRIVDDTLTRSCFSGAFIA